MQGHDEAWDHALAVTRPALSLSTPRFVADIAAGLHRSGLQAAIQDHNTARIVDWLISTIRFQGITDAAARAFDAAHGGVSHSQIEAALASKPSCRRLRSFWTFDGCGFRKATGHCAETLHQPRCPLPGFDLRKGSLNVGAFHIFLFVRDVCDGDLVAWIDRRLADADSGPCAADRAARMRQALIEPLSNISGIGPKILNMALADLLLAGDPDRGRWVVAGAAMIAVDSLIHNFLSRTGILRRLDADHPYGPGCHGPRGCAVVIEGLAARFDASEINAIFPPDFPRLVQHAIWRFCAASGLAICNGNKVDDRRPCEARFCPAGSRCDRLALRPAPPD